MISYWLHNVVCPRHFDMWLNDTSCVKLFEQVRRKCPPRNTTVQLSTRYADPKPSNSPSPKFLWIAWIWLSGNDHTEIMHENSKTPEADFHLKL